MKVSILGCGWLGLPLAKKLIEKGHKIKGSTTSLEKILVLESAEIEAFQISVTSEGIFGEINAFLAETEVLIIDIPPGLRKNPKNDFVGAMKILEKQVENSGVKNVIFVNSISVYEDAEDFPVYSEKDIPNAISAGGAQLISAEKIFIENALFGCTVIRFGGLIGGKRHPVKQLSGKKNIANPKAPVNLIQLEDCMEIILKIIEKRAFGHVFNAVFPEHPSKKSYYQKRAKEECLPLPEFDENGISKGKIIVSDHLEKELNFIFRFPL